MSQTLGLGNRLEVLCSYPERVARLLRARVRTDDKAAQQTLPDIPIPGRYRFEDNCNQGNTQST